ncbi:MAG: carboxypeptidase-like regulatory domain-containing protein [Gemmatimonadota bacterium]|nr:carboxypeptidase-like regulatory domain-containing protein [Gemmatimonadota bacterium]
MTRRLLALVALVAAGSRLSPLHAQTIRGHVVDSVTAAPVADIALSLVDERGVTVAATTAGPSGEFSVQAPVAGVYRVRLQRIGYRTTLTSPFALEAQATITRSLAIESVFAALAAVHVTGQQECVVKPAEGLAAAIVWEEARKALEATRSGQQSGRIRMRIQDFTRELDLDQRRVRQEALGRRSGVSKSPYQSLDARVLAKEGYVQQSDTAMSFYAPDADVLLSDDFAAGHCFLLEERVFAVARAKQGDAHLIALGFEPVRSREMPDISGVLWVDRRTGALRSLDYHYTRLKLPPSTLSDTLWGGWIDFQPVSRGGSIVQRWLVRAPIVRVATRRSLANNMITGGRASATPVIDGIHEEGGEVLSATTGDGVPLWSATTGSIHGRVTSTRDGQIAPGVAVWLRGTNHRVMTDASGQYRFDSLATGPYSVVVARSAQDSLGIIAASVEVRGEQTVTADLSVSPMPLDSPESRSPKSPGSSCAALQSARAREADSLLALSGDDAMPKRSGDAAKDAEIRNAQVIAQVAIDTLGHPDIHTLRVLSSRSADFVAMARNQIAQMTFPPTEEIPGCKVTQVIVIPFHFRR